MKLQAISTIALVLLTIVLPPAAIAQVGLTPEMQSTLSALERATDQDCPPYTSALDVESLNEHIKRIRSEQPSPEEVEQMAGLLLDVKCGLSDSALAALDGATEEAVLRGLSPLEVLDGKAELITPTLLPEEWSIFESELGHSSSGDLDKVDPIILGCAGAVVALGVFVLAADACTNDVDQLLEDCNAGHFCSAQQIPDPSCCHDRWQDDTFNCVISGGTNGPDGDYHFCCS